MAASARKPTAAGPRGAPPTAPTAPVTQAEIALLGAGRFAETGGAWLRPWLARLLAAQAPGWRSLGVRFTGDRAMRRLNRDFRGKDQTTDVLSFPGGDAPDAGGHLGDIVISVPAGPPHAPRRGRAGGRR